MTTTRSHAAPWTLTRYIADLFSPPTNLARNARPALLTGREAAARAMYGQSVQWSALDMAEYDNNSYLQEAYLLEADRRIGHASSPDRHVAAHWGYTPAEWLALPALVQVDKREGFFAAQGLS